MSYTHDFPGHFVSLTLGQFPFSNFDGNAYSNNEQVNFIGYSLAQNGSQNYSQGSLGAYIQVNPTKEITLAAGFQDANNVLASNYIQFNTVGQGQYSWFVYGAWSPLSGMLRNGSYSLFYYNLPSVEMQPQASSGLSFNAAQPIGKHWGLFVRANTVWNSSQYIQSSIAGGAVYNNPLGRSPLDQIGLGFAWNRVNQTLYTDTYVNPSETMVELYWAWSVKHLLITPDVQLYFQPALTPTQSMAAVFSLRVTVLFWISVGGRWERRSGTVTSRCRSTARSRGSTGSFDWLESYPPQEFGFDALMKSIDAILMGRDTYEVMRGFGEWPYGDTPIIVMTNRPLIDPPRSVEARSGDLAIVVGRAGSARLRPGLGRGRCAGDPRHDRGRQAGRAGDGDRAHRAG